MNYCGVVCEFNPFHNGHEYLIKQAKLKTNSEIICLMSGNFVQRGEPAIVEKYTRAKYAISAGANAVLELPTIFACSNAENFAYGAIKIFKALNVKYLAFGIEQTSLEILQKIAELKYQNSIDFQNAFKNEIENGVGFNTALKRAISKQFNDESILEILSKPNNILAIEYLTAIKKLNAKIKPIAIERTDNGYYNNSSKNEFISASAIRNLILKNANFNKFVPKYANFNTYFDKNCFEIYNSILLYNIRNSSIKYLENCYDYNDGIEYKIKKSSDKYSSLDEVLKDITSPRYRENRVRKLLLYPTLNITKNVADIAKKTKPAVKVLAILKLNKKLLETSKSKINLIVTNKDYENLSNKQKQIIEVDLVASNFYNTIIKNQNNNDKKTGTLFL